MSDTPITDELSEELYAERFDTSYVRMRRHARNLERQLAEANRLLATVTEQRDAMAAVLKEIRAGYGGQVTDPWCGCDDCAFLRRIDGVLNWVEEGSHE